MASDAERVSLLSRIHHLEKENQELRQEVFRLKSQVNTLKAHDIERRTTLWKKLQSSIDSKVADISFKKPTSIVELSEQSPVIEKLKQKPDPSELAVKKDRPSAPQKLPPPRTNSAINNKETNGCKPQTPPASAPPPPPPPIPSKLGGQSKSVRRVPEVMEFYRLVMKRDVQKENKSSSIGTLQDMNPRNMIGEIENRSTYLLAIKSEVETHGEFINYLSREVEKASFSEISEVEPFVKWLDSELSCLVDERAVLKHFPQWPERKADALREAACSFRELKSLESEVLSFKDNHKQLLSQSLRKMLALQDRLERSTSNIEKVREGTSKRYRDFHIPWDWMLESGVNGRLKLSSLALAKQFMERIIRELQSNEPAQDDDLLRQGVRFAYRVHQVVLMQIPLARLNGLNSMENNRGSSSTPGVKNMSTKPDLQKTDICTRKMISSLMMASHKCLYT